MHLESFDPSRCLVDPLLDGSMLVNYYQATIYSIYSMIQHVTDVNSKIANLKTQKRLLNEQHQAEVSELKNKFRNSVGNAVINTSYLCQSQFQ